MTHHACILLTDVSLADSMHTLLLDVFDIDARIVGTVDEITATADKVDCIIVDSDHFVANVRFFLPRQSRTLVITSHRVAPDNGDLRTIAADADRTQIIKALAYFFESGDEQASASGVLSQREVEVLRLIASGHINKEIADKLAISLNTVLTHRKNITAKLGIKSVSGLTFYAMMNGLVTPH